MVSSREPDRGFATAGCQQQTIQVKFTSAERNACHKFEFPLPLFCVAGEKYSRYFRLISNPEHSEHHHPFLYSIQVFSLEPASPCTGDDDDDVLPDKVYRVAQIILQLLCPQACRRFYCYWIFSWSYSNNNNNNNKIRNGYSIDRRRLCVCEQRPRSKHKYLCE